jgi:hypothetical protein
VAVGRPRRRRPAGQRPGAPPRTLARSAGPNPLDEPAPLRHRDPFGPSPSESPAPHPGVRSPSSHLLDPEVANPLAALLDVLAGHIERDDEAVDPQTRLTAVSLARSLIRSYPAPEALTEESPG